MKILLIRLSSIGDIVLTSPVLRCLALQRPGDELHMMVKAPFRSLADASPYVARALVYGEPIVERYDCVVDLQGNARSRKVCRQLRPARVLRFRKQNVAKALLTLFKRELVPIRHVCDRYLEAVAPLGVANDNKGLDFFLQPVACELPPSPYRVLVVGANHRTKTIPIERLRQLAGRSDEPVLLLGGKAEAQLTQGVDWPAHVTDLCGKTTLMESAALLAAASRVVSPDTGMMHIAVALGTPLTLVWGSTDPRYGFAPYQPHGAVEQLLPRCACHPCGKLGHERCPRRHFRCMEDHFNTHQL